MFGYSKEKFWTVIVTIIVGIVFALPSFLPTAIYEKTPKDMRSWFKPITLGLDLQGGSYLLMEVDTKNLVSEKLEGLADLTRSALRSEKVRFSGLKVEDDALTLKVLKAEDLNTVRDTIRKQESGIPLQIDTDGTNVTVHYTEDALNIMKRQAVTQSLEIVRKRIDELGTKEPQIQQQGADRIVIQLPGVQDPSEIKALMGKTAKLTFHLVDENTNVVMARQGKISPDSMLMDGDETGPIVLKRAVVVGGESLEDARGTLFYHYAKFLEQLQPKMFLFENVRGLLTHDQGRTYATILDIFESTGYTIQKQVMNAWDYGVAQKRERLITIGIRNDLVDKVSFEFPAPHKYKPVLRDILLDCPKSEGTPYSEYKRKIFEMVPPGGYWRDIPEDIAKDYMKSCWYMEGGRTGILRRLSLDEPSLTVLTSPSQKQTDRCHPLEARPFTVRENARCQSFPDEWQFCGSLGAQYKQVGNAVPVNLAYDIATKIKEALENV